MIQRMPFDPVVTGFAHLSCAGSTDAEALALFHGERPSETPRPARDVIGSAISDPVFHIDLFKNEPDDPRFRLVDLKRRILDVSPCYVLRSVVTQ